MKKTLKWAAALIAIGLIAVGLGLRSKYVLDSKRLDAAIKAEIPPGTPKAKVIQFIQARKPLVWDDLGAHVKARMSGRAENLIYRKDIVLDFEFDSGGKLVTYSTTVYLTFL